ncbi:MAG: NAD-dependent epimerase/dehydratase family protein, partial [Desulfobacterales bacterium]|nr:NAD-dependent epimerase/dehydratase family protein [Desulfobacterales bacterium]
MEKDEKIFIAGSGGLVGSAIVRRLKRGGYTNLLTPEIGELDLTDQKSVAAFFKKQRPDHVILA